MELHVVLPSETDRMPAGKLVELAVLAEELGYAGVWLPDHILLPGGHVEELGGVFEPLVSLAHVAAVTKKIKLGTSVLVTPLRNPFVLARQIATLVWLSGDRFVFGAGVGWNETEFREVGAEFRRRGKATDEAIRLVNHMLEHGRGPYEDGPVRFTEGVFAPILGRRVPVHVGGVSMPAYRRAAALGDIDAARALVDEANDGQLFLYSGDQHYFADSSLPSYDPDATALLTERVLSFLDRINRSPQTSDS